MWSFATHTGAGIAIAGLTATYYALSRRNYQGERERMAHESGFGDGPQVTRLVKHSDNGQLSHSQMLLRKELEELSTSNGSVSGLNVLYQQRNPLHQFARSNFELTPIVSRVDAQQSTTSIYSASSEEDIIDNGGGGAGDSVSVFGSKPTLETNKSDDGGGSTEKGVASGAVELSLLEVAAPVSSEDTSPVISEEISGGDELANDQDDVSNLKPITDAAAGENEVENISPPSTEAKQSESVSAKWKSSQEAQFPKRTNSPICFFKNPGFGNRYAINVKNKKPELGPLVAATLSSTNINVAAVRASATIIEDTAAKKKNSQDGRENVQLSSSSKNFQNSTQFLLTPALSQSNVSVCEHDLPDKMVKKRRKRRPFVGSSTTGASNNTNTVVDTNPVEEITEYNKTLRSKPHTTPSRKASRDTHIILRADPAVSNLCPPIKKRVKPILLVAPPPPTVLPPPSFPESSGDAPAIHDHPEKAEIKKRVTFKEIKELDEKVLEPEDKENPTDQAKCADFNTNPIEKITLRDEDFLEIDNFGVLDESFLLPSQQRPDYKILSRSESSSSSAITHIPSNSWISFPVRIYTNSRATIPWPLIALCVLVVIIAGFVGSFLTRLANLIERGRHREEP